MSPARLRSVSRPRLSPLLHMGLGALRFAAGGPPAPLNVMIALTDACTRRCRYCDIPRRQLPELSPARLQEVLRELAALGTCRLGLWGGEPLLRPDLPQIIARAQDLGMWVSVVSNGDLVPERIGELAGLDHLLLSLDGARDAHDAVRGAGGHARVLAALEAARSAGIPAWTATVLTSHNLEDVPYLVDLAQARGHRAAFQVLHHGPALDGGRGGALQPDPAALQQTLRWLLRAARTGRPVANSAQQLAELAALLESGHGAPVTEPGAPPCLGGTLFLNIDTDGRLYPCALLVGREAAPSVAEQPVAEALAALEPPACNRCASSAYAEYNAMLRLQPAAVAGWLRRMLG